MRVTILFVIMFSLYLLLIRNGELLQRQFNHVLIQIDYKVKQHNNKENTHCMSKLSALRQTANFVATFDAIVQSRGKRTESSPSCLWECGAGEQRFLFNGSEGTRCNFGVTSRRTTFGMLRSSRLNEVNRNLFGFDYKYFRLKLPRKLHTARYAALYR